MKEEYSMRLFSIILLVALAATNVNAKDNTTSYLNLKADFKAGSHSVGFKLVHEYDYGRSYATIYDQDGKRSTKPNPRPMQIAIWYPTESKGHLMPYKEYIYADATKDSFHEVSNDEKQQLNKNFIQQSLFANLGTPDREYLANILELPTTVIANAKIKDGSFPLILFVNREYRGIQTNTVLMEYLASHGYVVATTASKDRTKSYQTSMSDELLIQANMDDIEFVKNYMQDFKSIDKNKTGVIGYFVGSIAAPILAFNDQNIGAVVNFQSLLNTDFFGQKNLAKFKYFNPQEYQTPTLDLWQPMNPDQVDEPTFYNQIKYADAYNFQVNQQFESLAFSSHFNMAWVKSTDKRSDQEKASFDRTYSALSETTLKFFDAYLKNNKHAKNSITKKQKENLFTTTHRLALAAPPTEQQFVNMVKKSGIQKASALLTKHKQHNPDLQVVSNAQVLNGLGYGILNSDTIDEAIAIFKFNVSLFPENAAIQDSLAEGYKTKGNTKLAIVEYKKVFDKNPRQAVKDNAINMLKEMGVTDL